MLIRWRLSASPWVFRGAIAVATVLVLLAVYLGFSWYIVNKALVAERQAVEATPEEYGMAYEEVSFHPRGWDAIMLRGWWIPAEGVSKGTIIWQHGLDRNRANRMELLRDLHQRGYSLLAFDLRGHGASDPAQMGAGIYEVDDVRGGIDFLIMQKQVEPGTIALMGLSYGASIVMMTAAGEQSVSALIGDSGFATLPGLLVQEISSRTFLEPWSARPMVPGMVFMGRLTKGVDVSKARPVDSVKGLPYPILIVHGEEDTRIDSTNAELISQAAPTGSTLVIVSGAEHGEAYEVEGQAYVDRVDAYLISRLRQPTVR